MRRFVTKDSKKDFYILYTLAFALISGFIFISFPTMGNLWCGVMTGFLSI